MTTYIHIGLYRARTRQEWLPSAEIYKSEDDAQADLPNIDNYQYTLVVPAAGEPKREDWSDILAEIETNRRAEARYERGLMQSVPGARR